MPVKSYLCPKCKHNETIAAPEGFIENYIPVCTLCNVDMIVSCESNDKFVCSITNAMRSIFNLFRDKVPPEKIKQIFDELYSKE